MNILRFLVTEMLEQEDKTKCIEAMDFMKDWDTYRKTLHEAIAEARKYGLTDEQIKEFASTFVDFLAQKVCPATPEEVLLKELWNVGTPKERKVLTSLLIKIME